MGKLDSWISWQDLIKLPIASLDTNKKPYRQIPQYKAGLPLGVSIADIQLLHKEHLTVHSKVYPPNKKAHTKTNITLVFVWASVSRLHPIL